MDGQMDIVTAPWQGSAHWVPGSENGWLAPKRIQDSLGRDIILSRYYDHKAGEYVSAVKGSREHLVSTYAMDWDTDGDLDLLLGAKDGRLYLRKNEGSKDKPAYADVNVALRLDNGGELKMTGGMTAARPVDWDGDGLVDLVCGSFGGGASWFRNVGEKGAPKFAKPQTLLAAPKVKDGSAGPSEDFYVTPVDYDGDGDLDLLVGGRYKAPAQRGPLTDAEKAELSALYDRVGVISDAVRKIKSEAREAATGKDEAGVKEAVTRAKASPEYTKLMEEAAANAKRRDELRVDPKTESGVWLYRRL